MTKLFISQTCLPMTHILGQIVSSAEKVKILDNDSSKRSKMACKSQSTAGGDGPSTSKMEKLDKEALGIFPIDPKYKPYSIKSWIGKDKKTKKKVVHKNEEKPKELLEPLLLTSIAFSVEASTFFTSKHTLNTVSLR